MSGGTIRLYLHLGYDHGPGALGGYFQALAEGRALASRCGTCERTWFPPHARCAEDGGICEPVELDGSGVVVSETRTRTRLPFTDADREMTFVLVTMAGVCAFIAKADSTSQLTRRSPCSTNSGERSCRVCGCTITSSIGWA